MYESVNKRLKSRVNAKIQRIKETVIVQRLGELPLTYFVLGLYSYTSRPTEGRLAIVTDAGRDAVDAAASGADEAGGLRLVFKGRGDLPMKR